MSSGKRHRRIRRVAVVTGTRAEYGLLRSTLAAINAHADLRLQLIVTGMHLLRKFGHTVDDIVRHGWSIDARIKMQSGSDAKLDQAQGLSRGVAGIARFLEREKTDIVVVLGDRIEAMAGALAATTTGTVLAHIHGGDLATGDLDDCLRHAITKLTHIHLPATASSAKRIRRMGEPPWRIHCVGAPGLDRLRELTRKFVKRDAGARRALVVQHPCGRSAARERRVMAATLNAVKAAGLSRTIVFPNSDRGHRGILEAIGAHRRTARNGEVEVVRSFEHDTYLRMLFEADVLVGNSSSGIIEAATAGTAAVNIGPRQDGRERSGRSVIDAEESTASIREAIQRAMRKRPIIGGPTVYGDGRSGVRIAKILSQTALDDRLRRKTNAY